METKPRHGYVWKLFHVKNFTWFEVVLYGVIGQILWNAIDYGVRRLL